MTWLLSRSMMHCPIPLVPNLQSVKGHSLFSSGTYKSGINCLLLMVWYVAHTSQGHLNTLLRCHCYRRPYISLQYISHMIFLHPDIKGLPKHYKDSTKLHIGLEWPKLCLSTVPSVSYVNKLNYLHLHQPH